MCQSQRHNKQHTYISYRQPSSQTQRVTSAHKRSNINVNRPLQERNKQQHSVLNSCYLNYKVPLFLLNFTVDQMPGDAETYHRLRLSLVSPRASYSHILHTPLPKA